MKRNLVSQMNILTGLLLVPLLVTMCATIGFVSFIALNFGASLAENTRVAAPARTVRIKTLPPLALAPVITEPAAPIEAPAEVPAEPVLPDPVPASEPPTVPAPVEEPTPVSETAMAQNEPLTPTDAAAETHLETDPVPAVSSEAVEDILLAENTAPAQNEAPAPAENSPPDEPASSEPTPPDTADSPETSQADPAAPTDAADEPFVPDSSFFDQLLEQVK